MLNVTPPVTISPWVSILLPLGIAVIGLIGTIWITVVQLRARRRELQDERAERERMAVLAEERHQREQRAETIEGVIDAISAHAHALSAAIQTTQRSEIYGVDTVSIPNDFDVKKRLSRISTRTGEMDITAAALGMLEAGKTRRLWEQGYVYGMLQERLEMWHVGRRSTADTVAALIEDTAVILSGVPINK